MALLREQCVKRSCESCIIVTMEKINGTLQICEEQSVKLDKENLRKKMNAIFGPYFEK